jgi:transcriptional regulator with XRE-family HTH domain
MKSAPETFPDLLTSSMESVGIDRPTLAERIGVDETYLMHMEKGRRTPDARVLYLLGSALRWNQRTKARALDLVGLDKQARREAGAGA